MPGAPPWVALEGWLGRDTGRLRLMLGGTRDGLDIVGSAVAAEGPARPRPHHQSVAPAAD